eukprot:1772367-Alexandrium_andersonii.AAC.1
MARSLGANAARAHILADQATVAKPIAQGTRHLWSTFGAKVISSKFRAPRPASRASPSGPPPPIFGAGAGARE